ncbi:MAG: hypothetical protein IKM90_06010 [Bacteroidaceae bacterium]|nr:hypothetical protein [Bacteroidaceae bacterium]
MDNRENRLIESFTTVGGILLIAGAAVYITGWEYSPYFYLAGSLMFASGQFADRYTGTDRIVKRLRRQQVLGAVFLLLTAALMFSEPLHNRLLADMNMGGKFRSFLLEITRKNNWIVTLTIGAVFELYSAFRLDHISGNDLESK